MTDIGRRRGATFAALIALITLASLAAALIGCAVGPEPSWRLTGRKNLDGEPRTVRGPDEQVRSSALDQSESYSVKWPIRATRSALM